MTARHFLGLGLASEAGRALVRAATAIAATGGMTAAAQTVAVSVDATNVVRIVDERLFGVNAVMWDGEADSDETIALVRSAGIRVIRVPGGSLSNVYRWHRNRTYNADEPGNENSWTWATGFDGFARLITAAQTQAFVSVNYGTGTPEMAAAWVAYANASAALLGTPEDVDLGSDAQGFDWQSAGYWAALRAAQPLAQDDGLNFLRIGRDEPVGIAHWEIGNENYGTWETDIQALPHDPFTYAQRSAEYIAHMKRVDPTIKIGVVVVKSNEYPSSTSNSVPAPGGGQTANWTPVVLHTLNGLDVVPDMLVYHRYEQGPGGESDAYLLQSARTWGDDAQDLRGMADAYFGERSDQIELVVTENNSVYTNPGKQSTSLVNGLFLADSVGNLLQTEFNALTWWDLRNGAPRDTQGNLLGNFSASLYGWRAYGDYGMLSSADDALGTSGYDIHPTYYAMKLLSYFARGGDGVVSTSSGSDALAAYAVLRADDSLALLAINKQPSDTITANVSMTGFAVPEQARIYSYGIANDEAARPNGGGCSDITGSVVDVVAGQLSLSLPAYSMSVITLGAPAVTLMSAEPTISLQPQARTVDAGQSATFQARAKGCPAPSYRWQRREQGATEWLNLAEGGGFSDVTGQTLSITTAASMSGDQFRLIAENEAGIATSDEVTLTVNAPAPPPPTSGGGGGGGGGGAWSVLLGATLLGLFACVRVWRKA